MSPSISNNVLPILPTTSKSVPAAQPEGNTKGNTEQFDSQLRQQVLASQAARGEKAASRIAENRRDEKATSARGDNDRHERRERVEQRREIASNDVRDRRKADATGDDKISAPTDRVEVSKSGQEVADNESEDQGDTDIEKSVQEKEEASESETENVVPVAIVPVEVVAEIVAADGTVSTETGEAEIATALTEADQLPATSSEAEKTASQTSTEGKAPSPASEGELLEAAQKGDLAETSTDPAVTSAAVGQASDIGTKKSGDSIGELATTTEANSTADSVVGLSTETSGQEGEAESGNSRHEAPAASNAEASQLKTTAEPPLNESTTTTSLPEANSATVETNGEAVAVDKPAPTSNSSSGSSFLLQRPIAELARGAAASEGTSTNGPRVDASRFVSRVSKAIQTAEQRGGSVQIRLSPPELGAMRIELSIQQGVLTAKVETETAAAKSMLLDNLPALKERLAAQEIRVDKFDVDVQQQNSESNPDWQAQQEQQDDFRNQKLQADNLLRHSQQATPEEDQQDPTPLMPPLTGDGGLNLVA